MASSPERSHSTTLALACGGRYTVWADCHRVDSLFVTFEGRAERNWSIQLDQIPHSHGFVFACGRHYPRVVWTEGDRRDDVALCSKGWTKTSWVVAIIQSKQVHLAIVTRSRHCPAVCPKCHRIDGLSEANDECAKRNGGLGGDVPQFHHGCAAGTCGPEGQPARSWQEYCRETQPEPYPPPAQHQLALVTKSLATGPVPTPWLR
jgi:hypothetical protein